MTFPLVSQPKQPGLDVQGGTAAARMPAGTDTCRGGRRCGPVSSREWRQGHVAWRSAGEAQLPLRGGKEPIHPLMGWHPIRHSPCAVWGAHAHRGPLTALSCTSPFLLPQGPPGLKGEQGDTVVIDYDGRILDSLKVS